MHIFIVKQTYSVSRWEAPHIILSKHCAFEKCEEQSKRPRTPTSDACERGKRPPPAFKEERKASFLTPTSTSTSVGRFAARTYPREICCRAAGLAETFPKRTRCFVVLFDVLTFRGRHGLKTQGDHFPSFIFPYARYRGTTCCKVVSLAVIKEKHYRPRFSEQTFACKF